MAPELERFYSWNELRRAQRGAAYLIFNANFGSQSVFCAPLLGERQPVLGPLVLGFQGACDLAVVNVGGARCFKLLDGKKIISTAGSQTTQKRNDQCLLIKCS